MPMGEIERVLVSRDSSSLERLSADGVQSLHIAPHEIRLRAFGSGG